MPSDAPASLAMSDSGNRCSHYDSGHCRSCVNLSIQYETQLSRKTDRARAVLASLSSSATLLPIARATPSFGSRAKAKMFIGGSIEHPIIGLPDELKKGKELLDCPIHHPRVNQIIKSIPPLITRFRIPPYSIRKQAGELKYFLIKVTLEGTALVRWVLRSRDHEASIREANNELLSRHPEIKVASINIQPQHTSTIEGDEEILLTKKQFLEETLGPRVLVHTPQSFSQVTPQVACELYEYVEGIVARTGATLAFDLYCGSGAFALFIAPHVENVIGVETSLGAVEAARLAAERNGFSNITFTADDADRAVVSISERPDLVIVNPPRRGLSEQLCERLITMTPKTIVYSSCNPETFARDCRILARGYSLIEAKPFDMFPHTEHMELVGTFERNY